MPRPPRIRPSALTIQSWTPERIEGPIRPDGPEQLWYVPGMIAMGVHWMIDRTRGRQITVIDEGAFLYEDGHRREPLLA